MRIGLGVNNCRSKSPRREESSCVCTKTHEDVNAFSRSLLPREKLIYTLTVGRASCRRYQLPITADTQSRQQCQDASMLTPVFISRQLSVWAVCGWQCQSFCLHPLLLNLNGNSIYNQGLNPAKC